jgi:hypothetical protein
MKFLTKYKLTFIGIATGAIAGYAYYHFVGCASGTCPITSHPLNSTAYGALVGALIFTTFKKEKPKNGDHNNEKV